MKDNYTKPQQCGLWSFTSFRPRVAAKALFTIAIFVFDEGISGAQKFQIDRTEKELVAYRTQRILTQGQKDRIAHVTKEFPSIIFVAFTVPEQEPWTLVLDIASALRLGGWDWQPFTGPAGLQSIDRSLPREGQTIADHVVVVAPSNLERPAKALVAALTDPEVIGMDDVQLKPDDGISVIIVIAGSKR